MKKHLLILFLILTPVFHGCSNQNEQRIHELQQSVNRLEKSLDKSKTATTFLAVGVVVALIAGVAIGSRGRSAAQQHVQLPHSTRCYNVTPIAEMPTRQLQHTKQTRKGSRRRGRRRRA